MPRLPIDMVITQLGQATQGQDHDEGGHGEADDDGGQHQRLRQRVGRIGALPDHRHVAAQAAHGEEEQVDRIGQQGQAQHHREGAPAQQQVDAAGAEHTEGDGKQRFHQ